MDGRKEGHHRRRKKRRKKEKKKKEEEKEREREREREKKEERNFGQVFRVTRERIQGKLSRRERKREREERGIGSPEVGGDWLQRAQLGLPVLPHLEREGGEKDVS